MTGDGRPDLVVGSPNASVGGVTMSGGIWVWRGGAPFVPAAPAPVASLSVAGAMPLDLLGFARGRAILIDDVTGDDEVDVVAVAQAADVGGVANAGAIYVWGAGASLTGALSPTATLTVPGAVAHDALGLIESGQAVELADVTGDGVLDVVAGTVLADGLSAEDAGAVYVWRGGPTLVGLPALTATLHDPGASPDDQLGGATGLGIQFADVTGDGALDIVVGTHFADPGGVMDAGAITVWSGGVNLAGTPAPAATLTIPGASPVDGLCHGYGQGVFLGDVTGDGVRDVVGVAYFADVEGVEDAGALYLWQGGSVMTGTPTTTFAVPEASVMDRLGN